MNATINREKLREYLQNNPLMQAAKLQDIQTWAALQQISERTMYNAKNSLGLQTIQIGKPPDRATWWLSPDLDKEQFKHNLSEQQQTFDGQWPP